MAADWSGGAVAVRGPASRAGVDRTILAPLGCTAAVAVLAAAGLAATPPAQLREYLRVGQFWFLDALFVLVAATTVWAGREVLALLDVSSKRTLAVVVCAAALLVLVAPRTNRIFYDEHIYQGIGQNLSDLHRAQMCNDGTIEYGQLQCWRSEYNKQPYGYPHLLSLAYRWFGTSESLAHRINVTVAGLAAGVVFLLAFMLTGEPRVSGFASLVFMLLPEQLRWAHSAAAEPSAAFACALAMLSVATFIERRSTAALAWMGATASWAVYYRPEAILILPVIAVALLAHAREELLRRRFLWMTSAWMLLVLPALAHLAAVQHESWGSSDDRLSLSFFWNNVGSNTAFYLGDPRFPVIVTLLALAGLGASRASTMMLTWFAAFWGIFLFFYAGSYDYGADVRFSLMSHAPLAVLAGLGTSRIIRLFATPSGDRRLAVVLAGAALLFQFAWYLPTARAVGEEAWAARADVDFAREFARELPGNAVVLTHNPGMFHLWGVNAAQLSLASTDPIYVRDTLPLRYARGVYLHWSFWCNVADPVQRGFCDRALAEHSSAMVRDRRVRDYRFAFYRVE
jgi:hypothetical protein